MQRPAIFELGADEEAGNLKLHDDGLSKASAAGTVSPRQQELSRVTQPSPHATGIVRFRAFVPPQGYHGSAFPQRPL
jgi:hypothetical protein